MSRVLVKVDNERCVWVTPVDPEHKIRSSRIELYCKVVHAFGEKDFAHIYYDSKQDIDHGPCMFFYNRNWYTCLIPVREVIDFTTEEDRAVLLHKFHQSNKEIKELERTMATFGRRHCELEEAIAQMQSDLSNFGEDF